MNIKAISIGLICFCSGYSIALINTDDGSKNPSQFSQTATSATKNSDQNLPAISTSQEIVNFASQSDAHTLSPEHIQKFKAILNQVPEKELDYYLSKAFPSNNFSNIQDKKQFSQRLLEELSQDANSNNQDLPGKIVLSRNLSNAQQSEDFNELYKNQQITAHYDTLGKVAQNDQVFVKWINQDTGEVLLFTPQSINSGSDKNWVSYSPPNGWKPGSYAIQYYQMNDKLTPIAQTSYSIKQVIN